MMNTSEIIGLCSSIVAFITSGITYLNVAEVKKQRIQSLRPDIIVNQTYFNIHNVKDRLPTKWIRIGEKFEVESSDDMIISWMM